MASAIPLKVDGIALAPAADSSRLALAVNPVHIDDLHATILHWMGIDHERPTCKYNGGHIRLTDFGGKVIRQIVA